MDVDIKDYDSTSKDDDIDHLFYTFKSIASTESVTVVLNGTKVRYVFECQNVSYSHTNTDYRLVQNAGHLVCLIFLISN